MQVVMQTVKQGLEECHLMSKLATDLIQSWRSHLGTECPEQSDATRESIIRWLVGNAIEDWEQLNTNEQAIAKQAMEYRFRIFKQRYLGMPPERAYRQLMTRLCSLELLRNKIRTLVSMSRDRQRQVTEVLQEVLQELLQSDRYMQQQIAWIAECTDDLKLRNALLFASLEEYCLRPIRSQPLLVYRFVNYLRRTARGGVTQVPVNNKLRLLSEEILGDDSDNSFSLLDPKAVADYQEEQSLEEQQTARQLVKQEFSSYLEENLGTTAAQWLQLYLQGKSQEAIAAQLNISVKEIYRLREKINYHAVRVFGLKHKPELVSEWLETSLIEHNMGLTQNQWEDFLRQLTPIQQQIVQLKKANQNNEEIAKTLNLKSHQVMTEWGKLYLIAQEMRSQA
ncbi:MULTISPECIES: HetZ-related protein 2 [Chroococcidiopsis]|nr:MULTISPECIES: HetZ-related protein 2 [Chroococcidiopsis]MBE9016857.1 helix-turn-helix domain-containing protein [Chroococcidiopsidales cyanobacterium LEGE 13417]PSM48902.1 helix-turn-helix domain-containing protein [Chroococcidiopsis sp. CCALA 051]